ncbi:MAG: restriction endonuclease subunit S [Chloroflexi bacterium]|nr:restriction endonuclease subunit S [Chloroflexota bacterium]
MVRLDPVFSELEKGFLYFFLLLQFEFLNNHTTGSTIPHVNKDLFYSLPIPLPPLPEQRAIAQVLRTVQRAKEATERVIAALKELKKSLMRHLFTYGPVPLGQVDRVPMQETELGPLPAHWRVVRLGQIVERTPQVDPRRRTGWRFKYVDVSSIDNDLMAIRRWQEFDSANAPSRARKLIKTNDVIIATIRPYLKRVTMVPPELDGEICSTAFCVLHAKDDILNPSYLFFAVINDRFINAISEHQRGSSYPAVTDSDILKEHIPLPPLAEQREIACILQAVDTRIAAEEKRKAALEGLFKTLLHALMTGRRRVSDVIIKEKEHDSQN